MVARMTIGGRQSSSGSAKNPGEMPNSWMMKRKFWLVVTTRTFPQR
jgi:hypothetical protein